jgi:hypothetical protein
MTIDGWCVSKSASSLISDFSNQHHRCAHTFSAIYIASFLAGLLWGILKRFTHIRDESHKRLKLSLDKLLEGKVGIEK